MEFEYNKTKYKAELSAEDICDQHAVIILPDKTHLVVKEWENFDPPQPKHFRKLNKDQMYQDFFTNAHVIP